MATKDLYLALILQIKMGACASARACVPSANVKHDRACNAQQALAICNKSSIEASGHQ